MPQKKAAAVVSQAVRAPWVANKVLKMTRRYKSLPLLLMSLMGAVAAARCGAAAGPTGMTYVADSNPEAVGPPKQGGTGTGNGNNSNGTTAPDANAIVVPGVQLVSRVAPTSCLEVRGGSLTPASPVDVWQCNGYAVAQSWEVVNGQVRASNNRCLDRGAGSPTPLVINPCDPNLPVTQQWSLAGGALQTTGDDVLCAALAGGNVDNGTGIVLQTCVPTSDAQHWNLQVSSNQPNRGMAIGSVQETTQCLSSGSATPAAGDPVLIAKCSGPGANQWMLNGFYQKAQLLGLTVGGQCLTAQSTNAGATLSFAACALLATQRWVVSQGQLQLYGNNLCVDGAQNSPSLALCDASRASQSWTFGGLLAVP